VAEPPRVTRRPLAWPTIRADNEDAGLDIDARTGQCGWDGQPVQYGWVVDALARAEYRPPRPDTLD
jgi:hypothetical protein